MKVHISINQTYWDANLNRNKTLTNIKKVIWIN